eukprot:SAG22_NODE_477_length_9978_cov_2.807268_1_plen_113_part_00
MPFRAPNQLQGSFRIGGTHGDSIVYTLPEGGGPAAAKCRAAGPKGQRCYPICLSMERWTEIVSFSKAAGLKLVFGLNMRRCGACVAVGHRKEIEIVVTVCLQLPAEHNTCCF